MIASSSLWLYGWVCIALTSALIVTFISASALARCMALGALTFSALLAVEPLTLGWQCLYLAVISAVDVLAVIGSADRPDRAPPP